MGEEIEFCKGGGCTAKLGPGVLEAVLFFYQGLFQLGADYHGEIALKIESL